MFKPMMNKNKSSRLVGLDIARSLAFLGMILVNFRLAMEVVDSDFAWLLTAFESLQGRSATLFVVLAGVGLQLSLGQQNFAEARRRTWKRAAFLFVLGMLNYSIFPADIMHYYAVYFTIAACCLSLTRWQILLSIVGLILLSISLFFILDYTKGWNFASLTYVSFASVEGMGQDFVRHTFFNGWHPVLPWLSFLLWGMWLAHAQLHLRATQWRMMLCGAVVAAVCYGLSYVGKIWFPRYQDWFSVEAMPPMPLFVVATMATASVMIGLCCFLSQNFSETRLMQWVQKYLAPVGQMTLSLYVGHILLGMGVLEEIGWLKGRSLVDVLIAATVFFVFSIVFAQTWRRFFQHGPLETLMRRLS